MPCFSDVQDPTVIPVMCRSKDLSAQDSELMNEEVFDWFCRRRRVLNGRQRQNERPPKSARIFSGGYRWSAILRRWRSQNQLWWCKLDGGSNLQICWWLFSRGRTDPIGPIADLGIAIVMWQGKTNWVILQEQWWQWAMWSVWSWRPLEAGKSQARVEFLLLSAFGWILNSWDERVTVLCGLSSLCRLHM